MKDTEIAKILGVEPSSVHYMKKNHPKRYALCKMGAKDYKERPEKRGWEQIRNVQLAEHIGLHVRSVCVMKKNNPKKFEILKRGYLIFLSNE